MSRIAVLRGAQADASRRSSQLSAGDVGYAPQGYGHYIENAGNDELEVLIVLNNGAYRSISLSA